MEPPRDELDGVTLQDAIRAARAGCGDALGVLLDGCREYLLLIAAQELPREIQPKVGASDIVQETFLDAQRDFSRFAGTSEAELLAWLRQILLNNVRDASRRYQSVQKRQAGRELPWREGAMHDVRGGGPTPSWEARCDERDRAVNAALARLSAEHRQVIVLRNLELRSFADIGQIMGRSPDAVRKLWLRAIDALQSAMRGCDVL